MVHQGIFRLKKQTVFTFLGLALWGIVTWLFITVPVIVVNALPSLLPLSVFAFLLFLAGLILLTVPVLSLVRSKFPRHTWIVILAASSLIVLYNLSPLAPSWNCFGKRIYVATVNAAGQNCREICTNNKKKPCGGWSSCWDKNISCSSAGKDQDGRSCQGCCFSCDIVCDPEPDPDQPPTISGTINCSQWGSNGWCIGNESLNLTATDPQGYTLTITGNIGGTPFTCAAGNVCNQPLPDGNGAINYTVTASQSGKKASGTTAWKRDTTPPTVTPAIPSPTGSNGWFSTVPVSISANGSDSMSGLASAQVSVDGNAWQSGATLDIDGMYTVDFKALDRAGNSITSTGTVNIDTIDPDLEFVLDGTLGTNGWYVSDVNLSAKAMDNLSGVDYSNVRADGGAWLLQQTLSDGVHDLEAQAADLAGHTKSILLSLRIDTKSPSSHFTSHTNNEVVAGIVNLHGRSSDKLSGMTALEISTDGGDTWNVANLLDGAWSYDWDTTALQNDSYTVKVRGIDSAGNRELPIPLTLLVDNFPPYVKVSDSWWIWESGEVAVSSNNLPIGEIKVTISDPLGRWPVVRFSYDPDTTFANITWDRRFADGTLAPSGNYRVTVLACDIYGNCASDRGQIKIPFITPVHPTATPIPATSPTPVSTMTILPSPAPQVQSVAPPTTIVETTEPEQEQPVVVEHQVPAIQVLAVVVLIALMWAISSAALADPRPRAIQAIAKTITQGKDKLQS
ncbi:MAG TPA: Ig-like domain-containing protein [Anaerolineales bacterium]|nr:Ig-like domain-containing protein [Anaerolineales bacterium]